MTASERRVEVQGARMVHLLRLLEEHGPMRLVDFGKGGPSGDYMTTRMVYASLARLERKGLVVVDYAYSVSRTSALWVEKGKKTQQAGRLGGAR